MLALIELMNGTFSMFDLLSKLKTPEKSFIDPTYFLPSNLIKSSGSQVPLLQPVYPKKKTS